ncbi:MAG TPA: hypothetical protein VKV30_13475 [Candidatus Angelobacter sp.]|nr:hypothetical protein [Candidatus Angelobacter sp.]
MSQTIHIFKKDVRRFSWEIVLSLLLLALYGWCQPASWESPEVFLMKHGQSGNFRYMGSMLLGPLLVLWWMVMLVRIVQEEAPAGDRQFWVTRPYRWPNLLAAKALLFMLMVNLPLLLIQLCLLAAAGFSPLHSLGRLLMLHLTLATWLLPVGALAVIAGGRTQLSRAAIVVLVFLIIWVFAGSTGFDVVIFQAGSKPTAWDWAGRLLLISIPLVVILRQYALRKTAQARWILLGGALVITAVSFAQPRSTLNEAEYPPLAPGSGHDFQVKMQKPSESSHNDFIPGTSRAVRVSLPLFSEGVASGDVVQVVAFKVTLEAPDGTRWSSDWQSEYSVVQAEPAQAQNSSAKTDHKIRTTLAVDKSFFDRNRNSAVNIHLVTAAVLFRDHESPVIVQANGEFAIQGIGKCVLTQESFFRIWCRSALAPLPMLGITSRSFKKCPPEKDELAGPPILNTGWVVYGYWGSDFGLSSVRTFTPIMERDKPQQASAVCKESAITLHRPEALRQFRVESDFKDVKLSDLAGQR